MEKQKGDGGWLPSRPLLKILWLGFSILSVSYSLFAKIQCCSRQRSTGYKQQSDPKNHHTAVTGLGRLGLLCGRSYRLLGVVAVGEADFFDRVVVVELSVLVIL